MTEDIQMERSQKEFNDYIAKEVREMKTQLASNTETTEEIVSILRTGKGFFKTVGTIGRGLRAVVIWLTPMAAGAYAIMQLIKELFKTKGGS